MKTWRLAVLALSFLLLGGCLVTFKDPLPAHEAAPDELLGHWTSKNAWGEPLNLQLSRPLLQARLIDATAPMAMVSSDFHLMRAMAMARQQGLTDVVPVAAATPLATRYNAWLREYFAMLSSWVLGEL